MKSLTLKWLLALTTIFGFSFTLVWLYKAPGFEPIIALFTIFASGVTLVTSEWKNPKKQIWLSERRILQSASTVILGFSIAWLFFEISYTSVSGLLAGLLGFATSFLSRDKPIIRPGILSQNRSNRKVLINNIREIWLNDYWGDALTTKALMPLHIKLIRGSSSKSKKIGLLNGSKDIVSVYQASKGNLLIIGEAGIGKTITLLQLVRELLESAEKNDENPIPVLFSLATWNEKLSFEEWLIDEMARSTLYEIPKPIGQAWLIDGKQISVFLDGLDDVSFEKRDECIDAIDRFQATYSDTSIVVCCRSDEEYQKIIAKLNVNSVIEIQPLSKKDVLNYIKSQLGGTQDLVDIDSELLELARNRLMLALLCENIDVLRTMHRRKSKDVKVQKQEIINAYVEDSLKRKGKFIIFNHKLILKWLHGLASRMVKDEQKTFLIERLQPVWLPNAFVKFMYRATTVVVLVMCWILFGIFIGDLPVLIGYLWNLVFNPSLAATQNVSLVFAMFANWGFSGVVGAFFVVPYVFLSDKITPVESLSFSSRDALEGLVVGSITGLICSLASFKFGTYVKDMSFFNSELSWTGFLFMALLGVLVMFLGVAVTVSIYLLAARMFKITLYSEIIIRWGIIGAILGFSCGVATTIVPAIESGFRLNLLYGEMFLGLTVLSAIIGFFLRGFSIILIDAKNIREIKRQPNYGIRQSVKNSLIISGIGLVLALIIGGFLTSTFSSNNNYEVVAFFVVISLFFAVLLPPGLGLIYGGMAVVQHYVLRLMLAFIGFAPIRYILLLEDARKLGFLKKVGSGYEFRHDLFLDYFSNTSKTSINQKRVR